MMSMKPTRRGFLRSGLCLVFNSSCRLAGAQATTFEPNAYIRIASDNTITLSMTCSEMGQGISSADCRTELGGVLYPLSGRRLSFGAPSGAASRQVLPASVPLKSPTEFRFIDKPRNRIDSAATVTGQAEFGTDQIKRRSACV